MDNDIHNNKENHIQQILWEKSPYKNNNHNKIN
jgi:hypothetical protein